MEDESERTAFVERLRALLGARVETHSDPALAIALVEGVGARLLDQVLLAVGDLVDQVRLIARSFGEIPRLAAWIQGLAADPVRSQYWTAVLARVGIILAAALAARMIVRLAVAVPLARVRRRVTGNWLKRALWLGAGFLLDILPMVFFAAAIVGTMSYLAVLRLPTDPPAGLLGGRHVELVAITIANASIIVNLIVALSRVVFAPRAPGLRLPPLTNETAHYLHIWIARLSMLAIYGWFAVSVAELLGLSPTAAVALQRLGALLVALLVVMLILQNRQPVARWIRGRRTEPEPATTATAPPAATGTAPASAAGTPVPVAAEVATPETGAPEPAMSAEGARRDGAAATSAERAEAEDEEEAEGALDEAQIRKRWEVRAFDRLRALLADIWHLAAILYVGICFVLVLLDTTDGFLYALRATALTGVVLVVAHVAQTLIERLVSRGFSLSDDLKAQFPGLEGRLNRFIPLLHRALVALIWVIALFAAFDVWGIDVFTLFGAEAGDIIVARLISVGFVLAVAFLVWQVTVTVIEHYLSGQARGQRSVERSARVRTLLPLVRNAVLVALAVITALMVLSELGIDTTPLIAGAGVIGLAIGFGAQTLAKDIITGIFILAEDIISVGDVVQVGSHAGVVEAMSIRTLRLRDLAGNVHTVPFSDVTTVINMTKDFSYYVLDVGVAYREDTDEVVEVLMQIGAELQREREYRRVILEPLEILGVDKFDSSAVIIKARIKTRPIFQWMVGREFNRRMKKRFDELGIEIPFPHTTVFFGIDKRGGAPPAHLLVEPAGPLLAKPGGTQRAAE